MNNKLSNPIINELSFLTLIELSIILNKFNDKYNNDFYNTLKYIAKTYNDEQIIPLLKASPKVASSDNRTRDEKLKELKSYYVKSNDTNIVTTNDIPMFKRGRKKQGKTLKDKIFELFEQKGIIAYDEVLKSGIINIAENTYKILVSQFRKLKNIKVKRGRKKKNAIL